MTAGWASGSRWLEPRAAARGLVLILLAASGAARLGAEEAPFQVTLDVKPEVASVGARLDAVLRVVASEGHDVTAPAVTSELGPFSVFATSWEGPVPEGSRKAWTWKATLAAFETGELEIPAIEIRGVGPAGPESASSAPVRIRIESVLDEAEGEGDLADLKPPASIPPDYRPLLVAVGALLALLAAALAAWWVSRRLASRFAAVPAPEDPFRRMPPHAWAYAELSALLEGRGADSGDGAAFFAEITRILKVYLGARYRTDLSASTTAEVPDLLVEALAPKDPVRALRSLLERADRIKFARELPASGDRRQAVDEAYRIVDLTKPIEEAPSPSRAGGS